MEETEHSTKAAASTTQKRKSSIILYSCLIALGFTLWMTRDTGVFSKDEYHYLSSVLALKHGRFLVPLPKGAQPSVEFRSFDPGMGNPVLGQYPRTPDLLSPKVPGLYAFLAYPFILLGWDGLFLINIIAFLMAAWFVFLYTERYAKQSHTPWLACLLFLLGTYTLEYAAAMWPHMLSLALCFGGVLLADRVRETDRWSLALLAGFVLGLAVGVRYQNILWAGTLGLGILLWSPRRWRASFSYGVGLVVPLLVGAAINLNRIGVFNPITKGRGYLSGGLANQKSISEVFWVFWARIVDYSFTPAHGNPKGLMYIPDPNSGAHVLGLAFKKSWVQSMPWVLLAMGVLLASWFTFFKKDHKIKRELRSNSLILFSIIAAFASFGFNRFDGTCYNQRYFFDCLPLVVVALAWLLDRMRISFPTLLVGGGFGASLAAVAWMQPPASPLRHFLTMKAPVILAFALLLVWFLAHRFPNKRTNLGLVFVLGLCFGWSGSIQVEDLRASRNQRKLVFHFQQVLDKMLPKKPIALVAYRGSLDAFAPLLLKRDLVFLDAWLDNGRDAPSLIRGMMAKGRQVYVLASGMPPQLFRKITQGFKLQFQQPEPAFLISRLHAIKTKKRKQPQTRTTLPKNPIQP